MFNFVKNLIVGNTAPGKTDQRVMELLEFCQKLNFDLDRLSKDDAVLELNYHPTDSIYHGECRVIIKSPRHPEWIEGDGDNFLEALERAASRTRRTWYEDEYGNKIG